MTHLHKLCLIFKGKKIKNTMSKYVDSGYVDFSSVAIYLPNNISCFVADLYKHNVC